MLKILITLLMFSLFGCSIPETNGERINEPVIAIADLVAYRARSPTREVKYIITQLRSYYINLYLLSKGFGFSEGRQIVQSGVEPHQRISKNRRDFNFT